MSASSLHRCIAIYELCSRLGVSTWKHLGPSHVRAVFGLPDATQRKLLLDAENQQLTVHELQAQVKQLRTGTENRGRPPLPALVKTLNKLSRHLDDAKGDLSELDALAKLDPEEAMHLYQAVNELRSWCEQVEVHFRQHYIGLDGA